MCEIFSKNKSSDPTLNLTSSNSVTHKSNIERSHLLLSYFTPISNAYDQSNKVNKTIQSNINL